MLRLLRSRPNVFTLRSRVHSVPARAESNAVRLQQVKIREKWFKPRSIVGAAVIYYACYQIYTTSVFGILDKYFEEQDAQLSEKERSQLEKEMEEEDPVFIPLPFTTREIPPMPYKGTDPEWRMFAKFSRNPRLIASVKASLADNARKAVEKHPQLSAHYGKEWKIQKSWIDIQYPSRPPPTFERQGICWDDDGVSITTQPVDSLVVFKLRRTLMPTAVTLSMFTFSTALAKQNLVGVAKYLGYEPQASQSTSVQQALERIRQHLEKPQPKASESKSPSSLTPKTSESKEEGALAPTTKTQTADGSTTGPATSPPPPSADSSRASPPRGPPTTVRPFSKAGDSTDKAPSVKDLFGVKEVAEHMSGPWQTMRQKFAKVWRPIRPHPPRGSLNLSGLVEVTSPKATIVIEVFAWFDPKTETFDPYTMILALKHIKRKQLAPER